MSNSQGGVAIIGAGTINQRAYPHVFQKQPNTTVVAVCAMSNAAPRLSP